MEVKYARMANSHLSKNTFARARVRAARDGSSSSASLLARRQGAVLERVNRFQVRVSFRVNESRRRTSARAHAAAEFEARSLGF